MRWRPTWLEVWVIIAVVVVMAGMLLPALSRAPDGARRNACAANCKEVGKAIETYRQMTVEGYYPFAWGPDGDPNAACRADLSLGLLYPQYVPAPQVFRCPSTENTLVLEKDDKGWLLRDSSYGYDCRIRPRGAGVVPIFGDMDGDFRFGRDTSTANHQGGENILYADGHVAWREGNRNGYGSYVSDDPNDNVFAEDAWHADTDAFLARAGAALGKSYEGYPGLWRKPVRAQAAGHEE